MSAAVHSISSRSKDAVFFAASLAASLFFTHSTWGARGYSGRVSFGGTRPAGFPLTLDDATPGISLFRRIFCRRKKDENQIFGAIKNRG